jgi:hypothetical protein
MTPPPTSKQGICDLQAVRGGLGGWLYATSYTLCFIITRAMRAIHRCMLCICAFSGVQRARFSAVTGRAGTLHFILFSPCFLHCWTAKCGVLRSAYDSRL